MLDNTILQIEVNKIFTIQLKNKIFPIIYYSKQIATTVTKLIKLIFNKVIIQNSRSNPFLRN